MHKLATAELLSGERAPVVCCERDGLTRFRSSSFAASVWSGALPLCRLSALGSPPLLHPHGADAVRALRCALAL